MRTSETPEKSALYRIRMLHSVVMTVVVEGFQYINFLIFCMCV